MAGRTGGRTVAGAVVGLLVGPAKWKATGRAGRVVDLLPERLTG